MRPMIFNCCFLLINSANPKVNPQKQSNKRSLRMVPANKRISKTVISKLKIIIDHVINNPKLKMATILDA